MLLSQWVDKGFRQLLIKKLSCHNLKQLFQFNLNSSYLIMYLSFFRISISYIIHKQLTFFTCQKENRWNWNCVSRKPINFLLHLTSTTYKTCYDINNAKTLYLTCYLTMIAFIILSFVYQQVALISGQTSNLPTCIFLFVHVQCRYTSKLKTDPHTL